MDVTAWHSCSLQACVLFLLRHLAIHLPRLMVVGAVEPMIYAMSSWLTVVAHHDRYSNPGSNGIRSCTLPPSYPAMWIWSLGLPTAAVCCRFSKAISWLVDLFTCLNVPCWLAALSLLWWRFSCFFSSFFCDLTIFSTTHFWPFVSLRILCTKRNHEA